MQTKMLHFPHFRKCQQIPHADSCRIYQPDADAALHHRHGSDEPFQAVVYMLKKNQDRAYFFEVLNKFVGVCLMRKIRMVFENPIMGQTFLRVFLKQPDIKDNNRMARGDYMIKPTGYWFWNCKPTYGRSFQRDKTRIEPMKLPKAPKAGHCSEERSLISPDYARNFICDFIIGKEQEHSERTLFDL